MPVRLGACLVAEFVGTFALCFIGILAIHSGAGLIAIALAHGLILSIMVTAAMPTSGGHLNPAVTFGFLITGKIKPPAAIAYIIIQLLAGTIAALAVYAMFGGGSIGQQVVFDGTPKINGANPGMATLAEIIATFFLVFAVWGTAADPRARNVGGFAIGLTVAADILAIGPITGASMNPARSFGPTLVASLLPDSHLWAIHWIYWVGPLVGAGIAAITYHLILWPRDTHRGIDVTPASDVPPTQQPR
ncbi:MAG TPA: aquaporin [Tepidisphaeraceae bacterium]|jgi:MIP family channel proteins|nr:aquaporin [Tepidisphaeraceae bacterium]